MSEDSIAALEKQIEETRSRIKTRLKTVASPEALSDLGNSIKTEAEEAKDEWVHRARAAGEDYAKSIAQSLKEKAQDNPLAVASIAAGIGWKLWRDPPIASALIGLGAYGLMTSTTADRISDEADENLISHEADESPAALVESKRDTVFQSTLSGAERALDAGKKRLGEVASDLGSFATSGPRNQILLGVAGLAVAAALGMAINRKR
jgi:hypothetical protein